MNYNKSINDFYSEHDENNRLTKSPVNTIEFHTTMHFLKETLPKEAYILDACAGTGIYADALTKLGYNVVACDLLDVNINRMQSYYPHLKETYTLSVNDLSKFEDGHFDVVLNFGAYYHEIDSDKRNQGIYECLRVLKYDGLFGLSYVNKFANIFREFKLFSQDKQAVNDYLNYGYHKGNQLFYATSPGQIEKEMNQLYLSKAFHVGTDGMKTLLKDAINSLDALQFDDWLEHHKMLCTEPSILGISEHGLYLGKKISPA